MRPGIAGVIITRPQPWLDDRGRLVEIFRAEALPASFVQSNHSRSIKGVLRGLHYHQRQADLWYLVSGRAQVALADLREPSGKPATTTLILESDTPTTVYIPPGVAHGFLALTDVDLIYWVTAEYDATDEYGVAWNDPILAIDWETNKPILSERDENNPKLQWENIPSFS